MNFDCLFKFYRLHWEIIKHQPHLLAYLQYELYWLRWKQKKLKLGKIVFDIQQTWSDGFLIKEAVLIRFIRQDNTDTDAASLAAWDAEWAWKWDLPHVLSLCIIIKFVGRSLRAVVGLYMFNPWGAIFAKTKYSDDLLQILLQPPHSSATNTFTTTCQILNQHLMTAISDLCILSGIFF